MKVQDKAHHGQSGQVSPRTTNYISDSLNIALQSWAAC